MNCKTGQKNAEQIVVLSIVIVLLNVRKAGKPLQVFYSNQSATLEYGTNKQSYHLQLLKTSRLITLQMKFRH